MTLQYTRARFGFGRVTMRDPEAARQMFLDWSWDIAHDSRLLGPEQEIHVFPGWYGTILMDVVPAGTPLLGGGVAVPAGLDQPAVEALLAAAPLGA